MFRRVCLESKIQFAAFCTAIEVANIRRSPGFIVRHVKEMHIKVPVWDKADAIATKTSITRILECVRGVETLTIFGRPFEELDVFLYNDDKLPKLKAFDGLMVCVTPNASRIYDYGRHGPYPIFEPSFLRNLQYLTLLCVGSDADLVLFTEMDMSGMQGLTHVHLQLYGAVWSTFLKDSPYIQHGLRTCSKKLEIFVVQIEEGVEVEQIRKIRGKRAHKVVFYQVSERQEELYSIWDIAKKHSEEMKRIRFQERGDEEDAEDSEGETEGGDRDD